MYKKTDRIFIVSTRTGYIPQLKMYGPIPNPIKVPLNLCLSMITSGIDIYQFEPKSKSIIKLNFDNIFDDKKFDVVPKKVEKAPDYTTKVKSFKTTGVKIEPEAEPAVEVPEEVPVETAKVEPVVEATPDVKPVVETTKETPTEPVKAEPVAVTKASAKDSKKKDRRKK